MAINIKLIIILYENVGYILRMNTNELNVIREYIIKVKSLLKKSLIYDLIFGLCAIVFVVSIINTNPENNFCSNDIDIFSFRFLMGLYQNAVVTSIL